MRNKKGVELLSGTMVVFILVLIVLVVLAIGFAGTWKTLWGKIVTFGGSEDDVQTIIEACQLACAKQSTYEFCKKSWNIEEGYVGAESGKIKCFELYSQEDLSCDITCTTNEGDTGDEDTETPTVPLVPSGE